MACRHSIAAASSTVNGARARSARSRSRPTAPASSTSIEIAFLDPTGTELKDFRPFTLRPTADGRGFYVTDWGHTAGATRPLAGRIWKVTYTGDDVKPAPRGKDTDSVEN